MFKKITIVLFSVFLLGGCSRNEKKAADIPKSTSQAVSSTEQNQQTTGTTEESQSKEVDAVSQPFETPAVVDGIRLTLKKGDTSDVITDGEKRILYSFEVDGKNMTSVNKGLGAIDFILITEDGASYKIEDTISNFGGELKPDEEMKGTLNFSVEEGKKVQKVAYKPVDTVLVFWAVES